ncbi:conserved hypothetical protein [Sporisorium reilianum SRZ2]|uniref:D-isomer specific 2-hydroxyacid dehydrogenase NAD-binding domain-containing protein n=1 Tax=Sporisorium reilianum (strain SRZ2) TaxID=999809 RepID=E6ZW51_SPORE|nr:conserved hypothetical protein [Sporisorium reilianum SRZ2]
MVNLCIAPYDPSALCLSPSLLTTLLPARLLSRLTIDPHPTATTTALLWLPNIAQNDTSAQLRALLLSTPSLKFIQLPMTGVEDFLPLMRERRDIVWCSARGCYSALVAEHALALALALMRGLAGTAGTAGESDSLRAKNVLIVGRGSIATELSALLTPFKCTVHCVGSDTTTDELHAAAKRAEVAFIACPLTPNTHGLFNTTLLACLPSTALLVNIARAQIIHTPALIASLSTNPHQRAALDVIHYTCDDDKMELERLQREGRVLVTDHAAIPPKLIPALLGERLRCNLQVLVDAHEGRVGEARWKGRVDVDKGY